MQIGFSPAVMDNFQLTYFYSNIRVVHTKLPLLLPFLANIIFAFAEYNFDILNPFPVISIFIFKSF